MANGLGLGPKSQFGLKGRHIRPVGTGNKSCRRIRRRSAPEERNFGLTQNLTCLHQLLEFKDSSAGSFHSLCASGALIIMAD